MSFPREDACASDPESAGVRALVQACFIALHIYVRKLCQSLEEPGMIPGWLLSDDFGASPVSLLFLKTAAGNPGNVSRCTK